MSPPTSPIQPIQSMRARMETFVQAIQDEICSAVSALDGSSFREDAWERPGGGGGRSRILQDTPIFEKAGVNSSIVHGTLSEEALRSMGAGRATARPASLNSNDDSDRRFFAAGVSLVIHPRNPLAPTAHANFRYFERGSEDQVRAWWFGGGCDLTPAYLFEEDARHFHGTLKQACDRHDPAYFPRFKRWCDDYFYIPHRGERRGVGGIFFDDLNDRPAESIFDFVQDCAQSFVPSYLPIVKRRADLPFEPQQKEWQQLRRGRYVEFNLMYDRGTLFGLKTGGRIESILMSLPLTARWEYANAPAPGSPEAALLDVVRTPRDWV